MEELNTSRIIGYGGESVVFYPGYKNAEMVSKFLFSIEKGIPSTIKNELIMNKIDPDGTFHVPITEYNKVEKVPIDIEDVIENYAKRRKLTHYTLWEISLPYGGKTFKKKFFKTREPLTLLTALIPYVEALVELSSFGYVNEDIHYENIVFKNGEVKMIDNSNLTMMLPDYALKENISNFIDMLDSTTLSMFNFPIKYLNKFSKKFKYSENQWGVKYIYEDWIDHYF